MTTINDIYEFTKKNISESLQPNSVFDFSDKFNTELFRIADEVLENSMQYEQVSPYSFDIPDDVKSQLNERNAIADEYKDWSLTPEGEEFIENYFTELEKELTSSIMVYEIKNFEDAVDMFGSLYYKELSSYNLNTIAKDIADYCIPDDFNDYPNGYPGEGIDGIYEFIMDEIAAVIPDYSSVDELFE